LTVVADSSPLIFLGKIDRLDLVPALFTGSVLVPAAVRDEVLARPIAPAEERALAAHLERCEVVAGKGGRRFAAALSRADSDVLALALRREAEALLADDRVLRAVSRLEGVPPVGTLGVLLRARRSGLLPAAEVRVLVDRLVLRHGFRLGIEVYVAVLEELRRR
jgi:hypothetical protein